MVKREVLEALMDPSRVAVLKVLLGAKEELVLKEISQKSKVPNASTFRILQEFVRLEVLSRREWKTSKVYRCSDNEKARFLKELFREDYDGVQEFVDGLKDWTEIQSIILQGSKESGKANLFLIGENIDAMRVEKLSNDIKQKGFDLSYLTLTRNQYTQMTKMGLYQGEKKVIK